MTNIQKGIFPGMGSGRHMTQAGHPTWKADVCQHLCASICGKRGSWVLHIWLWHSSCTISTSCLEAAPGWTVLKDPRI